MNRALGCCVLLAASLLWACSAAKPSTGKVASYLATSACAAHTDATSCGGDSACHWAALAQACPAGTHCPSGACLPSDACQGKQDRPACEGEASCAWSAVSALCPAGRTCTSGGYCHAKASDGGSCACLSPLYCPAGASCPAMECDCSAGEGGGTCSCSCAPCPPGSTCQPCHCACSSGADAGCVSQGTCACACPDCPAGESCPTCGCGCVGTGSVASGAPAGTGNTASTCVCPSCTGDGACGACTCAPDAGSAGDPCLAHADQEACTVDTASGCRWFSMGVACTAGQPCRSGVCQRSGSDQPSCACACPACPAGQTCPPCTCSCSAAPHCVPPPPAPDAGHVCPGLGCFPNCPNGIATDAYGCPTCTCK